MAKLTAPESIVSNSNFLENTEDNAGCYLAVVTASTHNGYRFKDEIKLMDGFSFECEVIGGKNHGKSFQLKFYDPKPSSSDGGAFARRKQFSALVAVDICKPDQLGKDIEFFIREDDSNDKDDFVAGSIFYCELELGKSNDEGKRYLDLRYANIYHVDDPRIANVKFEDDQRARIASITPSYRHPKDYFDKLLEKTAKSEKATASKPNFDDL